MALNVETLPCYRYNGDQMESFSQLLNRYIRRIGISDAELARAIGVSRQTVFRWREGLTERPRHRQDILAIARKLRLTPSERDTLLLAVGFQPETRPDPAESLPPEIDPASRQKQAETEAMVSRPDQELPGPDSPETGPKPAARPFKSVPRWWAVLLIGLLLLIIPGTLRLYFQTNDQNNPAMEDSALPPPQGAAPGETLVLVTQFANYGSQQIGYNIAGRLAEALQQEIEAGQLPAIRVAIWPEAVDKSQQALEIGQALEAALVIYGEYDAGRVLVKFSCPDNQAAFNDPALKREVADLQTLSTTINTDLPQQVRSLALMALGQIYLNRDEADQALPLLSRAHSNLQADSSIEPQTWAILNFHLGTAHHRSNPPNLDEAIAAYTQAIESWPQMISSRLNRISAYQGRQQPGDLELALADAQVVVAAAPEWGPAYVNRASIRISQAGSENLALALADLEKGLALESALPEAYFNRAYVRLKQGHSMAEAAPDLLRAVELRPAYGAAFNMLCWGYAVENRPEQALPYCEQAVAAAPDNPDYRESRGLAYALSGDYSKAIADFGAYVTWLEQQPDSEPAELIRHQQWLGRLKTGQNPLTPEVLADLRDEFTE